MSEVMTKSISIHALLAESDAANASTLKTTMQFLSTLSLRRATQVTFWQDIDDRISIHALLAESDPPEHVTEAIPILFLSTLSLRRATLLLQGFAKQISHFYPRSPCGERHLVGQMEDKRGPISIHALLAESDRSGSQTPTRAKKFLSTLSLRRATLAYCTKF